MSNPSGVAGRRKALPAWAQRHCADWLHSKFMTANLKKALTAAWQHTTLFIPAPVLLGCKYASESPGGFSECRLPNLAPEFLTQEAWVGRG